MSLNSTNFEEHSFSLSAIGHFDFSPLFENSILSILPSSLLFLVLPFRLWALRKEPPKISKTPSILYSNKLAFLAVYIALQAALLVLYAANSSVRTPSSLTAAVLAVLDALGLLLLSHAEHFRSLRPSDITNTYLFITLLFDIARTRTLWIQHAPKPIAAVFSAMLAVKLSVAITEAVEKRGILLLPYRHVSPEATSGIYSRAFFWWLNKIMMVGFRRVIRDEDLFPLEDDLSSIVLKRQAETSWARANKTRSHALFWSTLNANRVKLAASMFPRLALIGFRYVQPFLLSQTVDFVGRKEESDSIGWGLTGAFLVVFLGIAIASAIYSHTCYRFVTAVRGTLVSMIYAKTVDLSITALNESAAITLMSSDTVMAKKESICSSFQNLHEIWAVPVELGIALWLLQRQIGLSLLAPAAVALLSAVGTMWISNYIGSAQKIWNEGIQTRVDVSTSMLGSMKAVKFLGFTPTIINIVQGLRVKELQLSFVFRRLLVAGAFFSNNMRLLAPLITVLLFVPFEGALGRELTASSAFTTLSLIAMLDGPVGTLLRTIPNLKAGLACFDRIQSFLESDSRRFHVLPLNAASNLSNLNFNEDPVAITDVDVHPNMSFELQEFEVQLPHPSKVLIDVRNASFGWSLSGPPQINDVTFSVAQGSFVFIIGPVGCGKSTLLKGLMSETPSLKGFVYSNSLESAFADQSPWIQNTSIRDNIIGTAIFNESWYNEVIEACALQYDIAALPDSHDTIVGSRGISLSGGQKQRVALARSLYSKKELIIIDDGFSGLDAETEEQVFVRFFGQQGLLRKLRTTVLLVTHGVTRLSYADQIIALDANGHIIEQGTFQQLQHAGGYVEGLAIKHKFESTSARTVSREESKNTAAQPALSTEAVKARTKANAEEDDLKRPIGELSMYRYYFSSIGWSKTLLWLFFTILSGVAAKLTELVVTYWTNALSSHGIEVNGVYMGLYGMLTGIGTIFWVVACYQFFLYLVPVSAETLHARLLNTVMNAPLQFFTSTDTGITTNRFSQDMSIVDNDLPFALIDLIVAVVQAVIGAILMCFVAGYFALTLPPVAFAVWVIQKYYLRTSRQVRILDLEAKSPLYSHFIESLSGLVTIRAFNWSDVFVEQNLLLLDNSQKPYYLLWCIQRWLSLVLDLLVTVLAIIMMVLVVILRNSVDSGFVGLAILNVINFSQSLAWIIRQWTSLETSLGAISRLKNFTLNTPNENLAGEDQPVAESWPEHGGIEIKNLVVSYTITGPPVLKGFDMSINPGEKIGICGRTGSGKSSLIMTLFRLLETSSESSILVDGVDVTKIARQAVRSRFNAIPQDPFFMKGNIRLNASPENIHSDAEIILALTKVDLWTIIEARGGLNAQLDVDFFSHGQRQLFCLARAILRKSNLVVLDEASSNIDVTTDKLVQRVIREEFKHATIISVAHRLNTILDFDRVALLDNGELIEFDSPQALLGHPSAFKELYSSSY
ncbi:cyclic peptide transporter [Coleophoma crateriformis]|uniref:Cyclic peptide transporter n=1 Tax=Coleophoma crateriformis TaxID=565419 RepID=A0A3D8S9W9_9HELO|nr:cyclic peptide transporter [Coleophoma crateriformis]